MGNCTFSCLLPTLILSLQIDHLINQNHLFKRSIILIKAWCYYESRILGAHHGLISTYALETLVLYVFHVFNNTFSGPLEVHFLIYCSVFFTPNFKTNMSIICGYRSYIVFWNFSAILTGTTFALVFGVLSLLVHSQI